jgi:hypothetical protein
MVKTQTLHSFAAQKNALLNVLTRKIAATKVTNLNVAFDNKYSVRLDSITDLLNAIESKFRKCETLFYTYFQDIDHNILAGNITSLPFEMDCTLIDGTSTLKYYYKVDDKSSYKEMIDLNFQNFILMLASLYENLVLLAEIFIKKVMIYVKQPLSSPLHDYLTYLKRLIDLGYRQNDKLNRCMVSFDPFFTRYLLQINNLRNRFIHGYTLNLQTDGFSYFVKKMEGTAFSQTSPELIIDQFTEHVLNNTRDFIRELFVALKESSTHHRKSIPA